MSAPQLKVGEGGLEEGFLQGDSGGTSESPFLPQTQGKKYLFHSTPVEFPYLSERK